MSMAGNILMLSEGVGARNVYSLKDGSHFCYLQRETP
jgi:hypothetical protein